jgi:hypothetical protein
VGPRLSIQEKLAQPLTTVSLEHEPDRLPLERREPPCAPSVAVVAEGEWWWVGRPVVLEAVGWEGGHGGRHFAVKKKPRVVEVKKSIEIAYKEATR